MTDRVRISTKVTAAIAVQPKTNHILPPLCQKLLPQQRQQNWREAELKWAWKVPKASLSASKSMEKVHVIYSIKRMCGGASIKAGNIWRHNSHCCRGARFVHQGDVQQQEGGKAETHSLTQMRLSAQGGIVSSWTHCWGVCSQLPWIKAFTSESTQLQSNHRER